MVPLKRLRSNRVRRVNSWRSIQYPVYTVFVAILVLSYFGYLPSLFHSTPEVHDTPVIHTLDNPGTWDGWGNLERLFVFGDFFSATHFNREETQPSFDNPFGNPLDEQQPFGTPKYGPTGPLWIHFAAMKYNSSVIEVYDFATGGSTLDRDVIEPIFPTANTFGDQIDKIFLPNYATGWNARRTLFALWFGINDLIISFHNNEPPPVERLARSYASSIRRLYEAGARSFLLFNIPPMDKPYIFGKPDVPDLTQGISDLNMLLGRMRDSLMKEYPDISILPFDAHSLVVSIAKKPSAHVGTADLKYVHAPCIAYDLGIGFEGPAQLDRLNPKCGVPINQYLWHDDLHVTYPVHNAIAATLVDDCMGAQRQGYCLLPKEKSTDGSSDAGNA